MRVQVPSPAPNLLKKRGLKVDKAIEWLFQRTQDGATYLQVIVVMIIIVVLFGCAINTVVTLGDEISKEDEDK